MICPMDTLVRYAIVEATALDDLLELVARAEERLPQGDPLTLALTGVRAQVRTSAMLE